MWRNKGKLQEKSGTCSIQKGRQCAEGRGDCVPLRTRSWHGGRNAGTNAGFVWLVYDEEQQKTRSEGWFDQLLMYHLAPTGP